MNIPDKARLIMNALIKGGARDVLIVGGFVRDSLLGVESKDIDIEVYGMAIGGIEKILREHGFKVDTVGKAFAVLKIDNEIDVSIPRRDNKVGVGHKGFEIIVDPDMSVEEAASRRDFTINSMAMDINGEIIDPFGGRNSLMFGILNHTSEAFVEDPLRVMRAMQFAARFNMSLDPDTVELCFAMSPLKSELPKERIWEEWKKWALKGVWPSLGLNLLRDVGWLDPEIDMLNGCPQDPEWHPEGWSAKIPFGRDISTVNSCFTSAAQPIGADDGFGLGKFLKSSFAQLTTSPQGGSATGAQSSDVDNPINGLFTTPLTWPLSSDFTPRPSETISAHTMRFMRKGDAITARASKVIRVMFEVSQPSMLCVMRSAVNDFEILNTIVEPVSIFMMNMLFGSQWSTQFQFHQNAVQSNSPIFTGPTSVSIATIVVDATSTSVNGNVIVGFDLCFEGDVDFIHDNFLVMDKSFPSLFYTKITQGDVFIHTLHVVDAAAVIAEREQLDEHDRLVLILSALCHDFGKPETTKMEDGRWRSRKHCQKGVEPARAFLERIGAPQSIILEVLPLIEEHLVHAGIDSPSDKAIRRLANRIAPATIKMLGHVVEADHSGRPPLPKGNPLQPWVDQANNLGVFSAKPEAILMGRHLIDLGIEPGKSMGVFLNRAFQRQLDGEFDNLDDALAWAKDNLEWLEHHMGRQK